jgi:signal transduction histidine kinase
MPERFGTKHDEFVQQFNFTSLRELVGTERELLGLRRNGKEFPIEVAVSEVRNGSINYIGVIRDISERKHTEKLKNEFIATVSHELRTPLTSIAASLAIIESGSVGPIAENAASLIQIAKQNSLRLQSLISDLLDMDKLLANQMEFNLDNYDALATIERAIDANKYHAEKYQISFRITHVEDHTLFHADITRTLQVLGHLLSNAAKFSPPHSTVDIAITRKTRWVKFSVTDKGAGVPNEFKAHIFDSFSQADSSSTRTTDGSGLGLTISRELVEKMGGNIGFTSSPGQGSCFYIELPLAKINSTLP